MADQQDVGSGIATPQHLRADSPHFSAFLDLSRGLAAIAVFVEHLRAALFHGYPQLPPGTRTPFVKAWFFVTGFGFEAVVIFFVLSGYLVGGLGIGKIRAGTFRIDDYALNRLTRLFLVFFPGLLLTVLFDHLGAGLTNAGFWTAHNPVLLEKFSENFLAADTPARFVCNAAMLQSFACPVLGSNIPLWTLSYEFWFYVFFGLAVVAVRNERALRWASVALIAIVLAFLGYKFAVMLLVWGMGIGTYLYRGTLLRRPIVSTACFLAAATLSRTIGAGEPNGHAQDLVILLEGISFAWVLISVRCLEPGIMLTVGRLARIIAGFSYSLYLIHFPTMLLTIAIVFGLLGIDPMTGLVPNSAPGISLYLLIFCLVMGFAWSFALVTEGRTASARRWVRSNLTAWRHRSSRAID